MKGVLFGSSVSIQKSTGNRIAEFASPASARSSRGKEDAVSKQSGKTLNWVVHFFLCLAIGSSLFNFPLQKLWTSEIGAKVNVSDSSGQKVHKTCAAYLVCDYCDI